MDEVIQYFNGLEEWQKPLALVIVGFILYLVIKYVMGLWDKLMGYRAMKKRARLTKEVCEIIEDQIVNGLSEAIASKRITIDDARQLYGKFAHLGFWGLHPRKFTPKKTPEELHELKERLKAKRQARATTEDKPAISLASKFLDGIEAELAS
jgi:hypothetical protein